VRLHTSLEAKLGEAMTALTEAARTMIDPAYANGMGSLQEDPTKGLRCPLFGCGHYFHAIGRHWDVAHAEAGGRATLVGALSLPATAALMSHASLARRRRRHPRGRTTPPTPAQAAKGGAKRSQTQATVGAQNLRGRCEAQLRQRLQELATQLGRSPTYEEGRVAWGEADLTFIRRLYGTWNAFKRLCGQPTLKRGGQERYSIDDVITLFKGWHQVHGELPVYEESSVAGVNPATVLRACSASSWPVAMQRIALILNLKASRYYPTPKAQLLVRRCPSCAQLSRSRERCDHCGAAHLEAVA